MAIPRSTQRVAAWSAAIRMLRMCEYKLEKKNIGALTYWQRSTNEVKLLASLSEWELTRTHDAPGRSES